MRRWLAVCLLPLLNALRAFDLAAFRAALWQEGALLLALAAAAVLLWLPAGWKLEQGSLVICRGLAARRTLRLRPGGDRKPGNSGKPGQPPVRGGPDDPVPPPERAETEEPEPVAAPAGGP